MSSNFKDTLLKLLSATNYSVDDLSRDQISSFENLRHLKPLFEWLSQNLSEDNCITPEELEEFNRLRDNGRVKYDEELEEAIQSYSYKDSDESVPFKESLNDAEQELALLKEQLHDKQALFQAICHSNAAANDDIRELKKKQQRAEAEQNEGIKEIFSATKMLKSKISEVKTNVDELHDDIIGLAQNAGSPDVSSDEGIHSLTSENITLNKSTSSSMWSLTTSSSWQTIRGKDPNIKYLCQLSFDKYQRMHNQFSKHLTKLLDSLAKVGRFENNSDCMDLHNIKERLEKQMFCLIEKEAELEGIRAARVKVKELYNTAQTNECLIQRLKWEEKEVGKRIKEESFTQTAEEELASVCRQWAECKALQAVEHKMKERIDYSKCLIEKMDELLNPLILKLNADKILLEVLRYEKERIELSISLHKSFHESLQNQFDQVRKHIESMQENLEDYKQFCTLPLQERNDLVDQLASIISSDIRGVIPAVQNLSESSRREYETMYEYYIHVKNKLVMRSKNMEESYNSAMTQCTSNDTSSSEVTHSIQRGLDQIDCAVEDVNNDLHEVTQCFSEARVKNKKNNSVA